MDEHKKQIGITEPNRLVQTDMKSEQRKGRDTDTFWYDEVDGAGAVVAKYVVTDTTSMYPPQRRSITYEKIV